MILKTYKLYKFFGGIQALTNIDLAIEKGEFFSLIGPNGAGKTTLLNCINSFYHPTSGTIFFQEEEITGLKPHEIIMRGIGRTFQHAELFGHMSVLDNIKVGRHIHMRSNTWRSLLFYGFARSEERAQRKIIEDEIIELLELEPYRKEAVGSLPWGIQKRVDLARALASDPKILLLDEPTGGMSLEEREDMIRFILTVREFRDVTIIMIEHDIRSVFDVSDRIAVLNFGKLIAVGDQETILKDSEVQRSYFGKKTRDPSEGPQDSKTT
jgi:branched-chain amino acid transport system ATP-binding protein